MSGLPPTERAPQARRIWTVLDLVKWTTDYFRKKSVDSPRLTAEILLAEVLGCPRIQLYVDFEKPLEQAQLDQFRAFVRRRGDVREPVQYILGHVEFCGLRLKVTPEVLIPRPETEELADAAITLLKARAETLTEGETLRVLDLGTGSGCLALAIAHGLPAAHVTGVDLSPGAVAVATENAAALNLAERVAFLVGDLFAPLEEASRAGWDLIVSNPPYIDPALKSTLAPEVAEHEPAGALFAEEKGLAILNRIAYEASDWLKPGGGIGVEISPEQATAVYAVWNDSEQFDTPRIDRDLQGLERFVWALKKPASTSGA